MTGPSVLVLLRTPLSDADVNALYAWLAKGFGAEDDGWWLLRDADAVGLPCPSEPTGAVLVEPGPWSGRDEPEVPATYAAAVGFVPVAEIGLAMEGGRDGEHRLLAHLALALVGCYGGLIEVDGMVKFAPPAAAQPETEAQRRQRWLAANRTGVAGMPGRCYEAPYVSMRGEPVIVNVVDAEFLAAWLRHPSFRM
ncbi:DUF6368 family protein [Phytohabitans rumicis]|uniref:Uncharacterized protein n=1 Tax=Phytohabitans rumicis TaxID=1076125 RepID=A0A6V8LIQ8_9ACTN|nr:DUF6368 family protein [Phytohabitans rumicis]GFJ94046.1 hypothetical protein Prum_076880 [Phytohabitans rumicis]